MKHYDENETIPDADAGEEAAAAAAADTQSGSDEQASEGSAPSGLDGAGEEA
jgi:hypothetical protein